jgi:hypothetical protein
MRFLKALITPFSEILAGNTPTITGYFPGILVFLACVTGNNYNFIEIIFPISYQLPWIF